MRRIVTPAAKYWICKLAPGFIYEAMECLGGNGYVEESVLPRLYREAPVNAIWEGSGNVMCLDVLRALKRDQEAAELFGNWRARPAGIDRREGSRCRAGERIRKRGHGAHHGRQACGPCGDYCARGKRAAGNRGEGFARTRLVAQHGTLYGADAIDARTAETLLQRALPGRVKFRPRADKSHRSAAAASSGFHERHLSGQ